MKILKFLKDKGFNRTTCVAMALVILMTSGSYRKSIEVKEDRTNRYNLEEISKVAMKTSESVSAIASNLAIKEPTNEEKIAVILERENITREQLDIIIATVMGEAAPGSYEDAYAVINAFYNRKTSKRWINEVLRVTGEDHGDNIYEQITLINQSEVYTSGSYKKYLGLTEGYAYQATIDFLYSLEPMHDYLCFFASYGDKEGRVQFVPGGNLYYSQLQADDRVETVQVLVR